MRILVIRPDRIGDVILSTPVFSALKLKFPDSHLSVMVREAIAPLLRGLAAVDEVLIYDPQGRHKGLKGWFRLRRELKALKFDIAVVLQTQARLALALFFAGIRVRVGPLSKPHSFLVFNRGSRQRRSRVEMHEADYNLALLKKLGIETPSRSFATAVDITAETKRLASEWLGGQGYKTTEKLIAIHPGMGGSALNWPEEHYLELIRKLITEGRQLLLTFGPMDEPIRERMKTALGDQISKVMIYEGDELPGIQGLGALYSMADLVIAPSTGPLHLAVAVGTPVISFFPPVRVMSERRWGPYALDSKKAKVFTPAAGSGQDCMETITVGQVLEEVAKRV